MAGLATRGDPEGPGNHLRVNDPPAGVGARKCGDDMFSIPMVVRLARILGCMGRLAGRSEGLAASGGWWSGRSRVWLEALMHHG